jgi:Domain of unknown function (DUF5664)
MGGTMTDAEWENQQKILGSIEFVDLVKKRIDSMVPSGPPLTPKQRAESDKTQNPQPVYGGSKLVDEFKALWKDAPQQTIGSKPVQNVLRSLPADPVQRKAAPIVTGCVDYFPLALAEIAKISKAGNDQHNFGQPLHWARDKSKDHADCILRHLIERGTIDTDGQRHTAKAAWRVLALLQEELEAEAGWNPRP